MKPDTVSESSESLLKRMEQLSDVDDADLDALSSCDADVGRREAGKAERWSGIRISVWVISLTAIAWFTLTLARNLLQGCRSCECSLPTESLLGDIAWQSRVLKKDERFVWTDPGEFDGSNVTQIWDEIYPSAWIAVSDPSLVGFGGGVDLHRDAEDPSAWDAKAEAFTVAVMHQVHCVGVIKRSFMAYRKDETCSRDIDLEHIDHCVEYLRQAVICHGDLTLERPSSQTFPQGTTGWGNVHRCRDWDQLISIVKKNAIVRGKNGWIKAAAYGG